jgi:hypothetical protein
MSYVLSMFVTVTRMYVCVQSALMHYGMVNSKGHNKNGWNKHSRMITLMSSLINTFINETKVL